MSAATVATAPPPKGITLTALGSLNTGFFDEGAVEIAAYDPLTQRAFMTFAERPMVRVVNIANPLSPSTVMDLDPVEDSSTSVAASLLVPEDAASPIAGAGASGRLSVIVVGGS